MNPQTSQIENKKLDYGMADYNNQVFYFWSITADSYTNPSKQQSIIMVSHPIQIHVIVL